MSDILDVVCAIIQHKGKVLVTQRSGAMDLPGLWEFPGGKLHDGESETDALVREIREELHIEIEPLRRLPDTVHEYPKKTIRLIPHVCRYVSGEIRLLEHSEFRWLEFEDLSSLEWCPADIPVVKRLLNFC